MIEGHGDGLSAPCTFPEGEDDGQREQAEQLRMLENHDAASKV
jgi:hypothetical protein